MARFVSKAKSGLNVCSWNWGLHWKGVEGAGGGACLHMALLLPPWAGQSLQELWDGTREPWACWVRGAGGESKPQQQNKHMPGFSRWPLRGAGAWLLPVLSMIYPGKWAKAPSAVASRISSTQHKNLLSCRSSHFSLNILIKTCYRQYRKAKEFISICRYS